MRLAVRSRRRSIFRLPFPKLRERRFMRVFLNRTPISETSRYRRIILYLHGTDSVFIRSRIKALSLPFQIKKGNCVYPSEWRSWRRISAWSIAIRLKRLWKRSFIQADWNVWRRRALTRLMPATYILPAGLRRKWWKRNRLEEEHFQFVAMYMCRRHMKIHTKCGIKNMGIIPVWTDGIPIIHKRGLYPNLWNSSNNKSSQIRVFPFLWESVIIKIYRGMAQFGQSARLGAVRSQVRILLPRFFLKPAFCKELAAITLFEVIAEMQVFRLEVPKRCRRCGVHKWQGDGWNFRSNLWGNGLLLIISKIFFEKAAWIFEACNYIVNFICEASFSDT